jgi:hypothetical protein
VPNSTCVAIVGLLLLASEAAPQPPTIPEPPLVIEGRVLWIDFGSQAMALAPSNNTPAVTIDLHRIRQSDYHGFRGNEYVRVVGFILRPSRRIQAFELYLVTPMVSDGATVKRILSLARGNRSRDSSAHRR